MIKAKEFLDYLCNVLNYRFFSGVATSGLSGIFKQMKPDFMHYIPAANEDIAIKLATGVNFSGIKSAVMLHADRLHELSFCFNKYIEVPLLVLATSLEKPKSLGKHNYVVDLTDDYIKNLDNVSNYINKNNKVGVIFFKEDQVI